MSRKSPKIAALLAGLDSGGLSPNYAGYFACFNCGLYFEAHDVLEELWLAEGRAGSNYAYHKGLIQLAGAFVHLQKNRTGPAIALFNLAETNLRQYSQLHEHLDLENVLQLIASWRGEIESESPLRNPLGLRPDPKLHPQTPEIRHESTSTVPPR